MTVLQTGEVQAQNYCVELLNVSQRMAVQFDLGIPETEALMLWASMGTESPSQSISQARLTLMTGLKNLSLTMNNEDLMDAAVLSLILAYDHVRYAAIIERPGHLKRIVAYLRRYSDT